MGDAVLQVLQLHPLYAKDEMALILHLYSPFVPEDDIRAFLGRYCASVCAGEKLLDYILVSRSIPLPGTALLGF